MFKLVDMQCKKCNKIQEKWIETNKPKDIKACECGSVEFKSVCHTPSHGGHVSWSQWRV